MAKSVSARVLILYIGFMASGQKNALALSALAVLFSRFWRGLSRVVVSCTRMVSCVQCFRARARRSLRAMGWFTWYLIHFSTHFSYSPEASFGGEAVGNAVGEESLSHEHHGFVEVAFLAVESRRNSFASTEPVG